MADIRHSFYKYRIIPPNRKRSARGEFAIRVFAGEIRDYIINRKDFSNYVSLEVNMSRKKRKLPPLPAEDIMERAERLASGMRINYEDPITQEVIDSVNRCVHREVSEPKVQAELFPSGKSSLSDLDLLVRMRKEKRQKA